MPLATHLTTAGDIPSGSTTYITASISPSANALVLAWVASEDIFGTPTIPTASGCGLTWEQIDTVEYSNNCRETLFRALGASPTPGPVTFTFPGSEFAAIWTIAEFSGVSTSGSNGSGAIVQSAQNSDPAVGSSLTVTLGGTVAAANMVACGWCFNVNDNGMTAGANWTDLATVGIFRPMQILSAYNETGDETATATVTGGGARGGIAVELLGSGVSITVFDQSELGDTLAIKFPDISISVFDTDQFLSDLPPMPITGTAVESVTVEESAFCVFGSPFIGIDTITTTEAVTIGLGVAITVSDVITPIDVVESGSITVQPLFVVVDDSETGVDIVTVSRTATIEVADSGTPTDVAIAAMLLQFEVNDLTAETEAVEFKFAGGVEVFDSLTPTDVVVGEFNVVLIQVDDELLPSDFVDSAPTLRIDASDTLDATEVTERVFTTHVFLDDLHFINLESARRD